jgi:hypothetical protein
MVDFDEGLVLRVVGITNDNVLDIQHKYVHQISDLTTPKKLITMFRRIPDGIVSTN